MDTQTRQCKNNCIFCFVRQQPPDMRDSLRIFDDDYTLSFIKGNYITLTNLEPSDWARIYHWKMSPLYISVHTTDPVIREGMLRNPRAKNILKYLNSLKEHNIKFHTQIVLCPGWNDKHELDRTIEDLSSFYPHILSMAVVPVGLTRYRDKLVSIEPFDEKGALDTIKQVQEWQEKFNAKFGFPLVYLADEFYIKARMKFPAYKHYGDFAQLENGVGIVAKFYKSWEAIEKKLPSYLPHKKIITIACGITAESVLNPVVSKLNEIDNLTVYLRPVKSLFWGESVTVSGLLTGQDIIQALKNDNSGDELWISEVMVRGPGNRFLDNLSINDIEKKLKVKVKTIKENLKNLKF